MRKLTLFIAMSLNGKIARADGSVDWLDAVPNPEKTDYGYKEFLETVDTTIMGHTTYKQLVGWGIAFPYKDKTNFVITSDTSLSRDENVVFVSKDQVTFIRDLKQTSGKGIWLIGGGKVNTLLLNEDLIDEIRLFIMPVVIPGGIDIFQDHPVETMFKLTEQRVHLSGVVELLLASRRFM